MIDPKPGDVGRLVVYKGRHPSAVQEVGRITSFNEHAIFVRYGEDRHSKATLREDLEWRYPKEKRQEP